MIADLCWMDETLPSVTGGRRGRPRGPEPVRSDRAGLTREVVGASRGLNPETALFAASGRPGAPLFARLGPVQRTTFVRHAANLWPVTERLWHRRLDEVPHDPQRAVRDSRPV